MPRKRFSPHAHRASRCLLPRRRRLLSSPCGLLPPRLWWPRRCCLLSSSCGPSPPLLRRPRKRLLLTSPPRAGRRLIRTTPRAKEVATGEASRGCDGRRRVLSCVCVEACAEARAVASREVLLRSGGMDPTTVGGSDGSGGRACPGWALWARVWACRAHLGFWIFFNFFPPINRGGHISASENGSLIDAFPRRWSRRTQESPSKIYYVVVYIAKGISQNNVLALLDL